MHQDTFTESPARAACLKLIRWNRGGTQGPGFKRRLLHQSRNAYAFSKFQLIACSRNMSRWFRQSHGEGRGGGGGWGVSGCTNAHNNSGIILLIILQSSQLAPSELQSWSVFPLTFPRLNGFSPLQVLSSPDKMTRLHSRSFLSPNETVAFHRN